MENTQTPEEKYTEEFNSSEEIQNEFGGADGLKNYIAYRKAEDRGLVGVKTGSDVTEENNVKTENTETSEENYTAEFNESTEIQAEFGGADGLKNYIAYRKAEEAGQVKIKTDAVVQ